MSIESDVSDKCTPAECYVLDRSAMVTLLAYLHTHSLICYTDVASMGLGCGMQTLFYRDATATREKTLNTGRFGFRL